MKENEIDMLFTQVRQDNIIRSAYNEETVALKQAAILEVLESMKKRYNCGSALSKAVLDKKIQDERVDIRELHSIYPAHLLTFFNKKAIWKRIYDAKLDIPFMSNVR